MNWTFISLVYDSSCYSVLSVHEGLFKIKREENHGESGNGLNYIYLFIIIYNYTLSIIIKKRSSLVAFEVMARADVLIGLHEPMSYQDCRS